MSRAILNALFAFLVVLSSHGEAKNKRVEVNSHPLSSQCRALLEQMHYVEWKLEGSHAFESLLLSNDRVDWTSLAKEPSTAATYSPAMYHWVKELAEDDTILLEDGSEWEFDVKDLKIVNLWDEGAPIVISPKNRWLWGSNYDYVMTNRNTKESIDVNLFGGPIANGEYCPWVSAIDHNNGHIHLKNSDNLYTVWEVAPSDLFVIKEWLSGERVILGENTSWLWLLSDHNHIMINVEKDHYIRVRPIETQHYVRETSAMRAES